MAAAVLGAMASTLDATPARYPVAALVAYGGSPDGCHELRVFGTSANVPGKNKEFNFTFLLNLADNLTECSIGTVYCR